ncbi:MAG: hypothetical protein K5879_08200 [Lachnospiraceae bacterium]|nr:hypothetical protein [Lachnospiraceae bacterium]
MKYKFDNNHVIQSSFKAEDYFPAIVMFSSEELNNRFIEYSYEDTDMFEIVASSDTGVIKQFTLTLCNHFLVHDTDIDNPVTTDGIMYFDKSESIQCDSFLVNIFHDGIRVDVSEKKAKTFLKCGQLVFAFDEADSLSSLYVLNLSEDDIKHILSEINQ